MKEETKRSDIDWSHIIGAPKNNGKSRPIIVKFARYSTSVEFPKIKKMKGKSISSTESLPKKTYGSL